MIWRSRFEAKRSTLEANGINGRTYLVESRGNAKPTKVYESDRMGRKKTIATVPTLALGVMCAEHANAAATRIEAESANADTRERAAAQLERWSEGAQAHYWLSVPHDRMAMIQEFLPLTRAVTALSMVDDGTVPPDAPTIPPPAVWAAATRVNRDLAERGETPRIPMHRNAGTERPETAELLEMLQTSYRWDQDIQIVGCTWEDRGERWRDVASRYPGIFDGDGEDEDQC